MLEPKLQLAAEISQGERAAIGRLMQNALGASGQARMVADFLLAWHNAEENGGWNPVELWSLDNQILDDVLTALQVIGRECGRYPDNLGFEREIQLVWTLWR